MNRRCSTLAIVALVVLILPAAARADHDRIRSEAAPKELIPVPIPDLPPWPGPAPVSGRPLRIDVWIRDGGDGVFFPGESVVVCFRTNRDAFVLLYDIDTEGRAHRLYPRTRRDTEFVEGGVTYSVPGRGAGYRLMVSGPPGVETIVATASDLPLSDRWDSCWDGVAGFADYDQLGGTRFRVGRITGDRQAGVERLHHRLIEVPADRYYGPDTDVDQVFFRVELRWRGWSNRDRSHPDDGDRPRRGSRSRHRG